MISNLESCERSQLILGIKTMIAALKKKRNFSFITAIVIFFEVSRQNYIRIFMINYCGIYCECTVDAQKYLTP